jgi:diaminopimelate epimerase
MRFSKWHALGNTYLLVERDEGGAMTGERARQLCDATLGIGADGVLEVTSARGSTADVVIWNPDGSVAEMSGNGTRIAARWLAERAGAEDVTIRVGEREVPARLLGGDDVETKLGRVDVGEPETIDVDGDAVELTPVSVGNPHAVVRRDELARDELLRLGPLIEMHPRFPQRTNVQLIRPAGDSEIHALVWERGAGETSASGSSAVAVAAAAVVRGWCSSPVTVHLPGGDLLVRLAADGDAVLVGPAVLVCRGETTA